MRTPLRILLPAMVALVVAACGQTSQPVVDVDDAANVDDVAKADDGSSAADGQGGGEDRPGHTGTSPDGFTVEPEGQELALVGDDHVEVLYTLDPEGESVFRAAAVRPGSTRSDMTVVVVTSAEGMYDLRWLEVHGGEVGELQVFPEAYRMRPDLMAAQDLVPVVVWSPDGDSIAWLEPGDDGAVLRTVGWTDGPGTGRTADDNAAFGVEGAPSVLQARTWDVEHSDGAQTILTAEDTKGATYRLRLERQGDGGWAFHGLT